MTRSRAILASVGGLVAVQFTVLTALAAVVGTWQDDEYTLATTAHGVVYAAQRAVSYELQAPLYFMLVAALRPLDESPLFARMLSVVAVCAFTAAAAAIALRVSPARNPVFFAALVAANPFVVYAALEIRVYALALLLSAAMWLAFDFGYLRERRVAAQVALAALGICAIYTQYFLVFQLAGFALALAVLRRPRELMRYIASLIPVALAFLALARQLRAQVGDTLGAAASLPGAYGSIFVHPLVDFILPLDYQTLFAGPAVHVAGWILLAAVIVLSVAGRPRPGAYATAALGVWVAVEACYVVVGDVLHFELIVPRHFVALFVPEMVAAYAVVCAFTAPHAARYAAAVGTLAALAAAASLATDYRALAKQGDWVRVGAMLSAATAPGDVVAVFEGDAVAPLERYYRGPAAVVPFPRPLRTDRYEVDALVVHSEAEAAEALARLPRTGRLWLVEQGTCNRYDFYGCRELDAAVAKHYRIALRRAFYLNRVERLVPLDPRSRGAP